MSNRSSVAHVKTVELIHLCNGRGIAGSSSKSKDTSYHHGGDLQSSIILDNWRRE